MDGDLMDDLMNKLQNVLNDEESMKQIKELAGMLGGELSGQSDAPETPAPSPSSGSNQMPDLSQILSNLGGMFGSSVPQQENSAPQSDANPLGNIDISKITQLSAIMAQAKKSDKNVDLLLALRPLLKEENQIKIDRLIKIFKLFAIYPAIKESGLLGGDLFGLL